MKRTEFPKAVMRAAYARAAGKCERCGARLVRGKFRYDHDNPDFMGGKATLANCIVACSSCDTPKTAADQKKIAKLRRVIVKAADAKPPAQPIPAPAKVVYEKATKHTTHLAGLRRRRMFVEDKTRER